MKNAVIYIHGRGGSAREAEHYKPLFGDCDVFGMDYTAQNPWEAKAEFPGLFDSNCGQYETVTLIANSIGAYFAMCALSDKKIDKAYFISPVVDMERLIADMMTAAGVSETELREKGTVKTDLGQTLSFEYLQYARENPVKWAIPTHVLYGENDELTPFELIRGFADNSGATLTVMKNGEHWFHTDEQMRFLDEWIKNYR